VAADAARALGALGVTSQAVVDALSETVKSEDWIRAAAATEAVGVLTHTAPERTIPVLAAALACKHDLVLEHAMAALAKRDAVPGEAASALVAALGRIERIVKPAEALLVRMDPEVVVPPLVAVIEKTYQYNAPVAIGLLGRLGPKAAAATPVVRTTMHRGVWKIIPAAGRALFRMAPDKAGEILPVMEKALAGTGGNHAGTVAGVIAEVARDTKDDAIRKQALHILAREVTNEKVTQQVCQALGALGPLAEGIAIDLKMSVALNPQIAEAVNAALAKIKPGEKMEKKPRDVPGAGPDLDLDLDL
jgi:hypothetical protein